MEEHQKKYITKNLSELIDLTDCNTTCIAVLIENDVFGKDDESHLEAEADKRNRVLKFYQLIMKKADSYGHLITAMERGKQSGVLAILNGLDTKERTSGMDEQPIACSSRNTMKQTHVHKLVPKYYGKPTFYPIRFDVLDPVRLFTGRVEELDQLHQKLQQNDTKTAVISQMASIVGLGGIGKTELARTYMKNYAEKYDNNLIWINAETEETLTEGFRRLATDQLNLSKDKKITSLIDEVYNFFNGVRSLFVFDNAESKEYIHNFMPIRVTPKPFILITSRDTDWSLSMEMLELHEMNEQDAIQFVKMGLQIQDDHSTASIIQLVNRLQYFPLALSQAISYIKQKKKLGRFSIDDYLEVFESCTAELLNSKRPAAELNTYTKTTMTTWKVTTDLISATGDVGSQAISLLNMISYLQPDKIPIKLLLSDRKVGEKFKHERQQDEDAIGLLVKYSMVNIQPFNETLSIHRLVQEVTRNQLKKDGEEQEQSILRYHMNFFSKYKNLDGVSHACLVFKYLAPYKSLVIEFKRFPKCLLSTIQSHGASPYALNVANELREILLKHMSSNDVDIIRLDTRMVNLEYQSNRFESALKKLGRLLPFYEENKTGLFSESEVLYTQQLHAQLLAMLGRQTESLNFQIKLYYKLIALKGQNDMQTVDALVSIAECLIELGHFKPHLPFIPEYFQILPECFRTRSPLKIISLLKTAYENKKHLIGSIYHDARTFHRVSECLYSLNDKEEASIVARGVYECGKNSTDSKIQFVSMQSLNVLGDIKRKEGKHKDALKMYEEAHSVAINILGDSHEVTLITKLNMLITQRELGNLETALDGLRDVFKKMLAQDPDSPYVIDVESSIAVTLYKMKRYDECLKLLLDLKAKLKEKFPHLVSNIPSVNNWIKIVKTYTGSD